MNSHSAAFLLALGWYLMVPPLTRDYSARDDLPLQEWTSAGAFDSAAECERAKSRVLEKYQADIKNAATREAAEYAERRSLYFRYAQCIVSDDPRLR